MGDIGTERREVEFEPLPDEPVTEPVTRPTTPVTRPATEPARQSVHAPATRGSVGT